ATATARVVTEILGDSLSAKSILVLCGKGNNGGDGAAAGRLLVSAVVRVDLVLFGRIVETKGDARTNFESASRLCFSKRLRFFECASIGEWNDLLDQELAGPYDLIIDALFGTGLTRPIEGIFKSAVQHINENRRDDRPLVVSVDIPS